MQCPQYVSLGPHSSSWSHADSPKQGQMRCFGLVWLGLDIIQYATNGIHDRVFVTSHCPNLQSFVHQFPISPKVDQ